MAVKKPDPPVVSYKFQGMLNVSVFSVIFTFFCKFFYRVGKEVEMIDIHQNLLGFV